MGGAWQEYERSRADSHRVGRAVLAVVGVAAFAFVIYHHVIIRAPRIAPSPTPVQAQTAGVVAGEVIELPELPQPSQPPAPPIVAPGERAYAADGTTYVGVYECTVRGQRVVSDRPCGAGATARVIEVAPEATPPPSVPQRRPSQSASPSNYASSTAQGEAGAVSASPDNTYACEAVDRAIDNLNSRMRQRYGPAEGERLRAQWHALKRQRYDLRCGR